MKTILFILPNLAGGGAERAALELIGRLDRRHICPLLAILRADGELLGQVPADVPVAVGVRGLVRFSRQADLLIGGLELTATYVAVLLSIWRRKPVWGWVHTQLLLYSPARRWSHSFCLWLFYPQLDRIVAVSASAAAACRQRIPVMRERICVLPNPLDIDRIRCLAEESLTPPEPSPLILCIGKLDPNKGFDLAIQMQAELFKWGIAHHLVILGVGAERGNLLELAEALLVAEHLYLPGFDPNPYRWLKRAAVLVLPSRVEGFSTVVIEALSLGTPVVSTDCPGGMREMGMEEPDLIVPMNDVTALARAVCKVLKEPAIGQRFAQKGPRLAQRYQADVVVGQWEQYLLQE